MVIVSHEIHDTVPVEFLNLIIQSLYNNWEHRTLLCVMKLLTKGHFKDCIMELYINQRSRPKRFSKLQIWVNYVKQGESWLVYVLSHCLR